MIDVIIADDHAIVRQGLKNILAATEDMRVVGEAKDGKELLSLLEVSNCDVLVLDISMPGIDVLNIIANVSANKPAIKILILSMLPEEHYALRMLKAGAHGYMTKEAAPDELVFAIRMVHSGKRYISKKLASSLPELLSSPPEMVPHERLSAQEYRVFCLLASGLKAKEIAKKLNISKKTVYTYRTRILDKMKLNSTSDLIFYAVEHGIIPIPKHGEKN